MGISIGRAYQLGRRWNLEWEIGAGAVWLGYDKYLCKRCGDLVEKDYGWHFLPTRAALNMVYLLISPPMRNTRRIIPYALLSGLLVSCVTDHKLARVRISQPQMKEAVADTGFRLPRQITWTDDKGKEHIVTEATKDSVTGEYITQMELSEITIVAKSKQVAERNGKINLDFIVTVPGELISNNGRFSSRL